MKSTGHLESADPTVWAESRAGTFPGLEPVRLLAHTAESADFYGP